MAISDANAKSILDGKRKAAAWAEIAPILTDLRTQTAERMFVTGLEQTALRDKLFVTVQAIDRLQVMVEKIIEAGQSAELIETQQEQVANAMAETGLTRP